MSGDPDTRNETHPPIPAAVTRGQVLAIGRDLDPDGILDVGAALAAGGVRAFEVTLDGEDALRGIEALVNRYVPDELLVGAGTVLSRASAESAVAAGARFLVMPHTDPALIRWAAARGIPTFPGAFSPTEIIAAWRAGAAAVTLFPASAVGPTFVRDFRGSFPAIPLIPTGGVSMESAVDYLAAGAVAVGIGSWLTGGGDPARIRKRAQQLVAAFGGDRR